MLTEKNQGRLLLATEPLSGGMKLGRYRIEQPLGSGGMGVVYSALDELLERRVALKILPPDRLADSVARQRLLREARAAASLDHPNLCQVFDAGEDGGYLFIAMQLLRGSTLAERMRDHRIEIHECLEILRDVAAGLVSAHARQIVHRDLKPGNVMLTSRGAVVLDFGLAHMTESSEEITKTGEIMGTVPYMAPEQIRGTSATIAVDIFSLGVVSYEAIAGHRPFRGPNSAALMHAILHEPPPPLPSISQSFGDLERLVIRMLDRDPSRRPSAADVVARLEELLAGSDLSADVPTIATSADHDGGDSTSVPESSRKVWDSDSTLVSQSIDPEARRHYLKGRHLWNKRTPPAVRESIELYQQAIDIDPLFPDAYIGIADSFAYLSYLDFTSPRMGMAKGRAAAARALELDASKSQGHATLAWIKAIYDWDWAGARAEFEEAIRLEETNALAHHWYGIVLSIRGLIDKAREEVNRAFELDPLSPIMAVGLSLPEYHEGNYMAAVKICREITDSEPRFPAARFYLGRALESAGRIEEAVAAYRSMSELIDTEMEHVAALGSCLAQLGRDDEAREIEKRLEEASGRRYISPFYFALLASGRRDRDACIEHLDRSAEERASRLVELHCDPRFRWLHDDDAFRAIVDRVGFAPDA